MPTKSLIFSIEKSQFQLVIQPGSQIARVFYSTKYDLLKGNAKTSAETNEPRNKHNNPPASFSGLCHLVCSRMEQVH